MSTVSAASEPSAPVEVAAVRPVMLGSALLGATALLVAGQSGYGALLGATLALALVLAWGWPAISGAATPATTSGVLALSAVAVVLSALRDDLLWVGSAVTFGIVLSFLAQLRRREGRDGLVVSLLAALGGLVLIASGATAVVMTDDDRSGGALVVVAMAAVVASLLADLLVATRLPGPALAAVALVVPAAVGLAVGLRFEAVDTAGALVLAAVAGLVSFTFRRVLTQQSGITTVPGQVGAGVGSVLAVGALAHLAAVLA